MADNPTEHADDGSGAKLAADEVVAARIADATHDFRALVPTLTTAVLLVVLLTQRQLTSLRQMAQSIADAIATQTAPVCVQPLRAMRLRELLKIAESMGELPHVARVQIRTVDEQILADHRAADDNPSEITRVLREIVDTRQAVPEVLVSVLVDGNLHDAVVAQQADLRYALVVSCCAVGAARSPWPKIVSRRWRPSRTGPHRSTS